MYFYLDNAYLEPCSLEVMQATAWIPLLDANKTNGCMVVRLYFNIYPILACLERRIRDAYAFIGINDLNHML